MTWSCCQSVANEIEEQAVRLRQESIAEGTLPANFPVPYLSWSELQDSLSGHPWLELGRSTANEPSPLADAFQPGQRYGGRLKVFMDDLARLAQAGERQVVVSRQILRMKELWAERAESQTAQLAPEFLEGTLSDGWVLTLADPAPAEAAPTEAALPTESALPRIGASFGSEDDPPVHRQRNLWLGAPAAARAHAPGAQRA